MQIGANLACSVWLAPQASMASKIWSYLSCSVLVPPETWFGTFQNSTTINKSTFSGTPHGLRGPICTESTLGLGPDFINRFKMQVVWKMFYKVRTWCCPLYSGQTPGGGRRLAWERIPGLAPQLHWMSKQNLDNVRVLLCAFKLQDYIVVWD